jgi:hypothetical protein
MGRKIMDPGMFQRPEGVRCGLTTGGSVVVTAFSTWTARLRKLGHRRVPYQRGSGPDGT